MTIFEWCLRQTKGGGRGLKKVEPDLTLTNNHIKKALHNLRAVDYNIQGGFKDWAVSAAFYAMYHSLLAILAKFGYESKNQECTVAGVEHFIKEDMIKLDKRFINMFKRTSSMMPKDVKMLREEFQYGTETEVDKNLLDRLKNNAKEFVEATQVALEINKGEDYE